MEVMALDRKVFWAWFWGVLLFLDITLLTVFWLVGLHEGLSSTQVLIFLGFWLALSLAMAFAAGVWVTSFAKEQDGLYAERWLEDGWRVLRYGNPIGWVISLVGWACRKSPHVSFMLFCLIALLGVITGEEEEEEA